jgi:hypothetical protein
MLRLVDQFQETQRCRCAWAPRSAHQPLLGDLAMLYRGTDRTQLDTAYNNSAAVPERDAIVADWVARSARVRRERTGPRRYELTNGTRPMLRGQSSVGTRSARWETGQASGLVYFNDRRCHSFAELRSFITKARVVALGEAERTGQSSNGALAFGSR